MWILNKLGWQPVESDLPKFWFCYKGRVQVRGRGSGSSAHSTPLAYLISSVYTTHPRGRCPCPCSQRRLSWPGEPRELFSRSVEPREPQLHEVRQEMNSYVLTNTSEKEHRQLLDAMPQKTATGSTQRLCQRGRFPLIPEQGSRNKRGHALTSGPWSQVGKRASVGS